MSNETKEAGDDDAAIDPSRALAEFLESTPPNTPKIIAAIFKRSFKPGIGGSHVSNYDGDLPEILIHCADQNCNGPRIFRAIERASITIGSGANYRFFTYQCSNCQNSKKTYAVRVWAVEKENGHFTKLGEHPPYGPITPTRLLKLLGDQRELFLKGRQCENHGLGIGAFGYYRRVVENQRDRILDEIIKASRTLGAAQDQLDTLQKARTETQFNKSLVMVKDAIPQALLVKGHNPLTLLHAALSDGLHSVRMKSAWKLLMMYGWF